jgi:hypothetical protein
VARKKRIQLRQILNLRIQFGLLHKPKSGFDGPLRRLIARDEVQPIPFSFLFFAVGKSTVLITNL